MTHEISGMGEISIYKQIKKTKVLFKKGFLRMKKKKSASSGEELTLPLELTSFQATPLIVHLLMICSVGLYAIFGALVMRKLESRSVAEITVDVERRHVEQKEDGEWMPTCSASYSDFCCPFAFFIRQNIFLTTSLFHLTFH